VRGEWNRKEVSCLSLMVSDGWECETRFRTVIIAQRTFKKRVTGQAPEIRRKKVFKRRKKELSGLDWSRGAYLQRNQEKRLGLHSVLVRGANTQARDRDSVTGDND